jgi:hypothetical protein
MQRYRFFIVLIFLSVSAVLIAQPDEKEVTIPDSIKKRCDNLIIADIGKDLFEQCVTYQKCLLKQRTFENGQARSDYTISYMFQFPKVKEASFSFGFVYTNWNGKERLVSSAFLRNNKTDFPAGFKNSGSKIVNYEIVKMVAMNQFPEMKKNPDKVLGSLVLMQDSLRWHFYASLPQYPVGDGESYTNFKVYIDPYSGAVIAKEIN